MADQTDGRTAMSMADLARIAGTSKSTVSRVLSGRGQISAELRERVLRIVRETGFVPNAAASALARRRTKQGGLVHNTLALVFFMQRETFSAFWHETYGGILETADQMKLAVTLCLVRQGELDRHAPPEAFTRTQFDGILFQPAAFKDFAVLRDFAPTVAFGSAPYQEGVPIVSPDDRLGVETLVEHLAQQGHLRLDYVAADLRRFPFRRRMEALVAGTQTRGMTVAVHESDAGPVEVYAEDFARKLPQERATAIVASDDLTAAKLMRAMQGRGISTPEDVSIVGFDGRFAESAEMARLTTWQVHWRDLGRIAVRTLVDQIEGRPVPARTLVGGQLLERASSGRPAEMTMGASA